MTKKRLLACFAHPDDESFGSGGTLAHYAAQGVDVKLICATRGEAGEIADPSLASPQNLAEIREQELRCAAAALGISEIFFLGYRDSGMPDSADNQHPKAYMNAPDDKVVRQITKVMRDFQPHIIITFEPGGGYGHPDHIAISRHTLAAFSQAADDMSYPELGQPWQANRLFFTSIPRSFFLGLKVRLEELGLDTQDFDKYSEGIGWPDDKINVEIDISDSVESKWQAFHCHRTQLGSGNLFLRLPEKEMKIRMSREYFALANHTLSAKQKLFDLFADVDFCD